MTTRSQRTNCWKILKADALPQAFFSRPTLEVAPSLLGKVLAVAHGESILAGRIVESEAYCGPGDEASHACRRVTPRNRVMFGPPGCAYVYFSYGMHHLFNVVTENEGVPGAVLVRALEPLYGTDLMSAARRSPKLTSLCSGPGKLTEALGIDLRHNGRRLLGDDVIAVLDDAFRPGPIVSGLRIGISRSTELPWRFFLEGNPHVSRA